MKSTNLKPSREWNNQIKTVGRGLPRFALVWKLTSEKKKSDKFSWYVFRTELAGQCPEPLYDEGKKLYQSLAGGKSLEEQYEEDAVPF